MGPLPLLLIHPQLHTALVTSNLDKSCLICDIIDSCYRQLQENEITIQGVSTEVHSQQVYRTDFRPSFDTRSSTATKALTDKYLIKSQTMRYAKSCACISLRYGVILIGVVDIVSILVTEQLVLIPGLSLVPLSSRCIPRT